MYKYAMNIFLNVKVIFVLNHLLYSQLISQSFPDSLIGVHCTHGLNRTGYMICRYLIQKLKWEPKKAIDGKLILLNYLKKIIIIILCKEKMNF